MRRISRREMMVFAGAAGAVPLVVPTAIGNRAEFADPEKVCKVSTGKGVSLWVNHHTDPIHITENKPNDKVPISYKSVKDAAGNDKWMFTLPWAPHIFLFANSKDAAGNVLHSHEFKLKNVQKGMGHAVHTDVTARYADANGTITPYVSMCCYECHGHEYCIPAGHTFQCPGGGEVTCN